MEEEIKLTDDEWIRYIGLGLTIHQLEKELKEQSKNEVENKNKQMDDAFMQLYIYKNLIGNIKYAKDNLATLKSL